MYGGQVAEAGPGRAAPHRTGPRRATGGGSYFIPSPPWPRSQVRPEVGHAARVPGSAPVGVGGARPGGPASAVPPGTGRNHRPAGLTLGVRARPRSAGAGERSSAPCPGPGGHRAAGRRAAAGAGVFPSRFPATASPMALR